MNQSPGGTRGLRPDVAFRIAARSLRRAPATTLLAVVILALGLAFPATFFSFLVGATRPLPVPEGHRVVRVDVIQPARDGASLPLTLGELGDFGAPASLGAIGGFTTFGGTLAGGGVAALGIAGADVTAEVFGLLGVQPVLGRLPLPDDEATLLLSHRVWVERFEASPDVLGRAVTVDGRPHDVVGVMPERFGFPFNQDAWRPLSRSSPPDTPVEVVARLARGATAARAQAELEASWERGEPARSDTRRGGVVQVADFTSGRGEGGEAVAFVGLVLVALCLLLIACANVANLLVVRASERIRSLGVQSALGAGRRQIALQLLMEALLIATLGGAAGLAIVWPLVGAIESELGAVHWGYHWMQMRVDGAVLSFTAALVLGTALVAGVLPALRALRIDVLSVLKEGGTGASFGGEGRGVRTFVSAQLSLSCAALVAAGLAVSSLASGAGFHDPDRAAGLLVTSVSGLGSDASPIVEEITRAVAGAPSVERAVVARAAPAFGEGRIRFEVEGQPYARPQDRPATGWNSVGPGFRAITGLGMVAGRPFSEDGSEPEPVALVNESFTRRFGDGGPWLGRRLRLEGDEEPWRTVVGVVTDATVGGGERARHDRVYLPWSQSPSPSYVVLTTARPGGRSAAPADVRDAIAAAAPDVPVGLQSTLSETFAYLTRIPRVMSAFAIGGGAAGGFVAAVGLYGLLAFRVRRRRTELGVRLALGADARRLAVETLGHAGRQLLPAIGVGLALAWLASPVLGVFLLGTNPRALGTYALVGAGFLLVGLLAAALPALGAARTEPADVLRGA